MEQPRVVIVGGGITGLAAAYELVQGGLRPVLLDPAPQLGGVIQTEVVEGCVLEAGPDSFLAAKPSAAELVREVGLGSQLISSNDHERVTYVVRNGRLIPLPDGLMMMVPTRILPFLASRLLSWGTKLRMGLEYLRRPPRSTPADRSVGAFIRDHYGQEAVDYLAEPLLSGVYGGDVERLSVKSVLTRFVDIEARHGSLTRGMLAARRARRHGSAPEPLFQTLKDGLAELTTTLERRIAPHTTVRRARAETIERAADSRWRVKAGGEWLEASAVVVACPAWIGGSLLSGVHGELSSLLAGIEYSSSLTLALGYRRTDCAALPPGFGFLIPGRERRTLVACTFVGTKFAHRVPNELVVLRCFLGGASQGDVFNRSDDEIVTTVRQELAALLGLQAQPVFTRLARWHRSMAQYAVGHPQRMARLERILAALPGLHLAGNAYSGIGIPDCIRTGRAAARSILTRVRG
jgi:oxygen-dependent protoporphyrinogen oxidase